MLAGFKAGGEFCGLDFWDSSKWRRGGGYNPAGSIEYGVLLRRGAWHALLPEVKSLAGKRAAEPAKNDIPLLYF